MKGIFSSHKSIVYPTLFAFFMLLNLGSVQATSIAVTETPTTVTINTTDFAVVLNSTGGAIQDLYAGNQSSSLFLDQYWQAKTTGPIFSEYETDDTCSFVYNTTTYVYYQCSSGETDGSGNDWNVDFHAFIDEPKLLVHNTYFGSEKQAVSIDYNLDAEYEYIDTTGRQTFTANSDTNLNVTEGWFCDLGWNLCIIGNQSHMDSWGYFGPNSGYDQVFLGRYYNGGNDHYFIDNNWTTEYYYNATASSSYVGQAEWQKFMASNTSYFNYTDPTTGEVEAITGYFLNTSMESATISNFSVNVSSPRNLFIKTRNDTQSSTGVFYLLDGGDNILEWVNFSTGTNSSNATLFDDGTFMFRRGVTSTLNSFQVRESVTGPGAVTIVAPQNTTYYSGSVSLKVTNTSPMDIFYYSLNGGSNTTFTPNTTISVARGTTKLDVWANDSATGGWSLDTQYFTVQYWAFKNESAEDPVFETSPNLFEVYFEIFNESAINDITANFTWNGSIYTLLDGDDNNTDGQGTTYWRFSKYNTPNVTDYANNTPRSYMWNISVLHTDGARENYETTLQEQDVRYAYNLTALDFIGNGIAEGENATTNATILRLVNNASLDTVFFFNDTTHRAGSLLTTVGNYIYHTATNETSDIDNASQNLDVIAQLTITDDLGNTRLHNLSASTSIFALSVTNCTAGDDGFALWYNFSDELLGSNISVNVTATFQIWTNTSLNQTVTYQNLNVDNISYCIIPEWQTYYTIAQIDYEATNYSERSKHLDHAILNNITNSETLYLLDEDSSSNIKTIIFSSFLTPEDNVVVSAQKYINSLGSYITVDQGRTDDEGTTFLELETGNNRFYRFQVVRNGGVVYLDSQRFEFSSSETQHEIVLDPEAIGANIDRISSIYYGCSFDNTTFTQSCSVSDTTGIALTFRLRAWEQLVAGQEPVCSDSLTSSSGTLGCTVGNTSGKEFVWVLDIIWSDGYITTIASGSISDLDSPYSAMGMFVALFLVLIISIIGVSINPELGIIGAVAGVAVSYFLKLLPIEWSVVVGLFAAVAIIIWWMK